MQDTAGDGWQGAEWQIWLADEVMAEANHSYPHLLCVDGSMCSSLGISFSSWNCGKFVGYESGTECATDASYCCPASCGECNIDGTVARGSLGNGASGTHELCLANGCYKLAVGGGSADSELSWEFDDTFGNVVSGTGASYDGTIFCVRDGDVHGEPTPLPTAQPTHEPTGEPSSAPTLSSRWRMCANVTQHLDMENSNSDKKHATQTLEYAMCVEETQFDFVRTIGLTSFRYINLVRCQIPRAPLTMIP